MESLWHLFAKKVPKSKKQYLRRKWESAFEGLFFGVAPSPKSETKLRRVPAETLLSETLLGFSEGFEFESLEASPFDFCSEFRTSFSFVFRRRRSLEPQATGTASETLTMLWVLKDPK